MTSARTRTGRPAAGVVRRGTGGPRALWRRVNRRTGAAATLVVLVAGFLAVGLIRLKVDTSTESFLPAHDPTLVAVQQKARDFGGDPIIVLLRYRVPRQFLTDHDQLLKLLRTEGQLAKLPDVATVYGPATVLNQLAAAAQDFLAQIAGARDGIRMSAEQSSRQAGQNPAQVTTAGRAAVAQLDLRYAPLIVRGLPVGLPTLSNPRFAVEAIFGQGPTARPEWRFIVPDPDTVAILVRPRQDLDQSATQRLVSGIRSAVTTARLDTVSITVSGVPAVTASLTAEVAKEGPLLGALVAVIVLLRFLLVPMPGVGVTKWRTSRRHWLATRIRPLGASLLGGVATLALFGWVGRPISFASVLLLPLLLGVGSSFPLYLASVTNRRRVLVVALASAAAFLALAISPLPFVKDVGFALAIGVVLTVVSAIALGAGRPGEATGEASTTVEQPGSTAAPRRRPGARGTRAAVGSVVVAAATTGWVMLALLPVQANPEALARGLPALDDAVVTEQTLGASGEIGVELTGPDVVSPAALSWAHTAQAVLRGKESDQLKQVVSVVGLLGFLGPSPTVEQTSSALQLLPTYLTSAVIRPDHHVSVMVYGVKLQDLGAQVRMLEEVRSALPAPPPGYQVEITGLPVAAARGYQLLLGDRYLANLAGIVVAGLVLGLGLRRRADAARAVCAAALATGWGLVALWLVGVALNPLTMALGSLVTVTGCEFLTLLAESRRRGVQWLQRSVGYACVTSVLGYLVLLASRLVLLREFGAVLAAAVVLSYLAARLVIWLAPPAAGPGGADSGELSNPPGVAVDPHT